MLPFFGFELFAIIRSVDLTRKLIDIYCLLTCHYTLWKRTPAAKTSLLDGEWSRALTLPWFQKRTIRPFPIEHAMRIQIYSGIVSIFTELTVRKTEFRFGVPFSSFSFERRQSLSEVLNFNMNFLVRSKFPATTSLALPHFMRNHHFQWQLSTG